MSGVTDGIVVGYDGSPDSAEALRWAAREAWARGTALTICLAWRPDDLAVTGHPEAQEQARRRGEQIIARAAGLAESLLDLVEVRAVLAEGSPARVLCERSNTAEMVVVGSHGQGRLPGSLLGPVSWQVAGHAQGRIVVVRGEWRPVNQAPGPVVAGVDGSAASQAALAFASDEAALRDVPLIAVCALADAPGRFGAGRQMEEDFSHLMTRYEKEHSEVTVLRQVEFGAPRSALLTAATGAQLLVVGSRGLGGLEGMSLGSVAATLLHHAPCPVAVVHPPVRAEHQSALALLCASRRRRPDRLSVSVGPGHDQHRTGGHVQEPAGHAAQQDAGQVGAAARAQHHQARVVVLGTMQDGRRDVPEFGLADLALGADARCLQLGHDLGDHALAIAVPAVHLDAAETTGGELVHVQDDDVVSAVAAEVAGHARGGQDVPGRVV
jgi:nucleotide-binding universal stress UspA family protein